MCQETSACNDIHTPPHITKINLKWKHNLSVRFIVKSHDCKLIIYVVCKYMYSVPTENRLVVHLILFFLKYMNDGISTRET